MTYKVIRVAGVAVAFGPNDDNYAPSIPPGGVLTIEVSAPQLSAPAIPSVCSPWQIRKALNAMGIRTTVESAIAASTDQALRDGWEYASEFRSDDPFVLAMGAALNLTAEQTRQMIADASLL